MVRGDWHRLGACIRTGRALAVFAWPLHRYRPETTGCENGAVSEAAPCAYVGVGRPPLVLSELGRIYT